MNSTTILVPTYFAGPMLLNCVSSIMQNVKSPKLLVYKNDIGWLQACNKLMRETTDDIILLNDDTVILTDIVEAMSSLAYSDPKIGIVGGKALNPAATTIINYGIYVAVDGNTAHRYYGKPRESVKVEKQKAVEGSCMFIKRELINEIGIFDEGYGMGYREEVDLAFRAREVGWKVVSSPDAEYIHYVSQTNGKLNITNDTFDYFLKKWGAKLKLGKV